jgi:hypothetical protein
VQAQREDEARRELARLRDEYPDRMKDLPPDLQRRVPPR